MGNPGLGQANARNNRPDLENGQKGAKSAKDLSVYSDCTENSNYLGHQ